MSDLKTKSRNFRQTNIEEKIVHQWLEAKKMLQQAQYVEKECRHKVLENIGELQIGSNNFDNGFCKLNITQSEKFDVVNNHELINKILNQIALNDGLEIAQNLIQWKPSLSKKVYDKLSPLSRQLMAEILTVSLSSPIIKEL